MHRPSLRIQVFGNSFPEHPWRRTVWCIEPRGGGPAIAAGPVTRVENQSKEQALKILAENGLSDLGKAVEIVLNAAMKLERTEFLAAGPYERTDARRGHANGFKPKRLKTRVGELDLEIPQVRNLQPGIDGFYPRSLERGLRSERALLCSFAEMYVQGVSTRRVARITEQLCGFDVTSSQVSRATENLDGLCVKCMRGPSGVEAGSGRHWRYRASRCGLPCSHTGSAPPSRSFLSRLNTRPTPTPVDASRLRLPATADDSAVAWAANPSTRMTFTFNTSSV